MIINVRMLGMTRKNVNVENTSIIKDVMDENGLDYENSNVTIAGQQLSAAELHKSFAEIIGDSESCTLASIARKENA